MILNKSDGKRIVVIILNALQDAKSILKEGTK